MNNITIAALILGIVALSIVMFMLIRRRRGKDGEKHSQNYKGLFVIGMTWIPIGIATEIYALMAIGIVFMIIGLKNKSKWKDEPEWANPTDSERRLKISMIVGLIVLMTIGVALHFLNR